MAKIKPDKRDEVVLYRTEDSSAALDERHAGNLADSVLPLAKQLVEFKPQMQALGMFTNDRELLKCPTCDMAEDVTADGFLVTFHRSDKDQSADSGLCFDEIEKDLFRCPVCGAIQKADVL